jgi:hypothetical protein
LTRASADVRSSAARSRRAALLALDPLPAGWVDGSRGFVSASDSASSTLRSPMARTSGARADLTPPPSLPRFRRGARLAALREALVGFAELQPVSALVRSRTVLMHRGPLLELAARLLQLAPVEIAVVARLAMLVWDQASPAYRAADPASEFA